MEAFTTALLAALVVKITSIVKYLTAGQVREAVTQLVPWGGGVIAIWLAANASVTEALAVFGDGSPTLGSLDMWSIVLAGLAVGSGGSLVYDFKKGLDNTDTAAEPPLGGGSLDKAA